MANVTPSSVCYTIRAEWFCEDWFMISVPKKSTIALYMILIRMSGILYWSMDVVTLNMA